MANYRYPYIADKNLYRAVMGACSYIRETGWFNKATEYYADLYGVDVEDVQREVRRRQSVGQRANNHNMPTKKFTWFAIQYASYYVDYDNYEEPLYNKFMVKRALSLDSLEKALSGDPYRVLWGDTPTVDIGRAEGFSTKKEAEEALEEWRKEYARDER